MENQHMWYLDNGCSKHMTRDKTKFFNLLLKHEGYVTYGDNNKGKILGRGTIGDKNSFLIHDVLFMEGLEHNLLSTSQLCDKAYQVTFKPNMCEIRLPKSQEVLLIGKRINNVYLLDILNPASIACLLTKHEESWLWHRRIAHIHMHHLNKLISEDLEVGLPKLKFEKNHVCEACQKGKKIKHSFKLKNVVSTSKPLDLLHMDLFGPLRTMSLGGNYYAPLVIIDDFSRFTWTLFLESKSDAYSTFKKLAKRLENVKTVTFMPFKVIMEVNFKMKNSVLFVKKLESFITSLVLELPNKMRWSK